MLQTQPLETITITDIVKASQVSRTTFYHYFDSRDSLLKDSLTHSLDQIKIILNQNLLFHRAVLTEMLDYIRENRAFFLHGSPITPILIRL
ncbi:TetR/AcrR family transcriptional regulator [Streptococcus sp. X13SY08]|uniref:TetR/AcrR family transcriptional regulator n=1 Tax=Streptococcus sp. X13SY08 TaxID=1676616 RepID=UPI000ABBCD05